MKTNDILKQHTKTLRETTAQTVNDLKEELKESRLDGLVRRKSDGRLGWLQVRTYAPYMPELAFYPRTKAGEMSLKADGYIVKSVDVREEFEPAEEA